MGHVVLLGDSIFDNASYVPGGPAVIDHLRRFLPTGWSATLLARDGATTADVGGQVAACPRDATHVVLSVGGNDALEFAAVARHEPARTFLGALERLAALRDEFRARYRDALGHLHGLGLEATVCTIYDAVPGLATGEAAGLAAFNEVILREAFAARLPVVDLRLVCADAADYSSVSPIEPSARGGFKIADAIGRRVWGAEEDRRGIPVVV